MEPLVEVMQQKAFIVGLLVDYPYLLILFFLTILLVVYLCVSLKHPRVLDFFPWLASLFRRRVKKCEAADCARFAAVLERLSAVNEALESDKADREARQARHDERLDVIDTHISNLFSVIEDHEEFSKTLSRGTLTNILFNDTYSPFQRLRAFRRLLAMGANGRAYKVGFQVVLENKEDWLNVLDTKLDARIADQAYFDNAMDEIRKHVFDGFM